MGIHTQGGNFLDALVQSEAGRTGNPKQGQVLLCLDPPSGTGQGVPMEGGLILAPPCPSPSFPADGAQQPDTQACSHGDALHLHFRLLQGLTAVVMKVCVTWLLFKQGLMLLPLCWEHKQPLSSTGHYCSAGSLRSVPKCAES